MLGRDDEVNVVSNVVLYPFGHRAVVTRTVARDPNASGTSGEVRPGGTLGLRLVTMLEIKEPVRATGDRSFPFDSVEVLTPRVAGVGTELVYQVQRVPETQGMKDSKKLLEAEAAELRGLYSIPSGQAPAAEPADRGHRATDRIGPTPDAGRWRPGPGPAAVRADRRTDPRAGGAGAAPGTTQRSYAEVARLTPEITSLSEACEHERRIHPTWTDEDIAALGDQHAQRAVPKVQQIAGLAAEIARLEGVKENAKPLHVAGWVTARGRRLQSRSDCARASTWSTSGCRCWR